MAHISYGGGEGGGGSVLVLNTIEPWCIGVRWLVLNESKRFRFGTKLGSDPKLEDMMWASLTDQLAKVRII
jgi:hypothetical protein